ncbi:hypothetical protein KAU51_04460 [Candidatus Parcubacteria bacterium]|nr:hypothetical protein [Candidatus Parcubacteria bacterium]
MSKVNMIFSWENFISSGENYRREMVVINGFVEGRAEIKKVHLSDER